MCTADELAELKAEWARDPYWDLEDAQGFEEHREELMAYRRMQEAGWAREHATTGRMMPGMAYRDWLAGRCLAALATAGGAQTPTALAERAVALADSLITCLWMTGRKEAQP